MLTPLREHAQSVAAWTAAQLASVGLRPLRDGQADDAGLWSGPPPALESVTGRVLGEAPGQGSGVRSVRWQVLPDGGLLLATTSRDGGTSLPPARIWDVNPLGGYTVLADYLADNREQTMDAAWLLLTDGRLLLAIGTTESPVKVWRVDPVSRAAALLCELSEAPDRVWSLAWQVIGGQLLLAAAGAGESSRQISLWRIDPSTGNGDILRRLIGHNERIGCVAWQALPDGRLLLASASHDSTVRIWEVDPDTGVGDCLHVITSHGDIAQCVAWQLLPDGRLLLATGSWDKTARVWEVDPGTGLAMPLYLLDHGGVVWGVAWLLLADGRLLLGTGSHDRTARVWDGLTGRALCVLDHPAEVNGVEFAVVDEPGGQRVLLATGGQDGTARVWLVEPDPPVARPAGAAVMRAAVWPPDSYRVTGLADVTPALIADMSTALWSVAWHELPDGRLLLVMGDHRSGDVRVWEIDPMTGAAALLDTGSGHGGEVNAVAWQALPDGRLLLASADRGRTVEIWEFDPVAGALTRRHAIVEHADLILSVAWQLVPGGRLLLATASWDDTAQVWDVDPVTLTATAVEINRYQQNVHGVAWQVLPDGRVLLAVTGDRGLLEVRQAGPDGQTSLLGTAASAVGSLYTVAWHCVPGGQLLLATSTGGGDTAARIWGVDPATGEIVLLDTLTEHHSAILSVAWCGLPDGRLLLASAGYDGTVRVWDVDPDAGTAACLYVHDYPGTPDVRLAWHQAAGRAAAAGGRAGSSMAVCLRWCWIRRSRRAGRSWRMSRFRLGRMVLGRVWVWVWRWGWWVWVGRGCGCRRGWWRMWWR